MLPPLNPVSNDPASPSEGGTFSESIALEILSHERYQVRAKIGEGAFGSVYRGWDNHLQREVAIKIPKAKHALNKDAFLREARVAARLRHPGLVTVFDAGTDREGKLFAVYELIDGTSLARLAAAGKLELYDAVRLIAEAAEAMHFAHKDIVHRDLKPSNILVEKDGRARVTDFGLALDEQTLRDRAGEVSGSPAYMSPEQVRGESHRLDGRTDIWSLGVILYELLTGRRPFWGRDQSEYFDEILNREPKPLRQLNDGIPKRLEFAVLKCLAKPVRERYATAGDFASDLRDWLKAADDEPNDRSQLRKITLHAIASSAPTAVGMDPQVTTSREKLRLGAGDQSSGRRMSRAGILIASLFAIGLLGIAAAQVRLMLQMAATPPQSSGNAATSVSTDEEQPASPRPTAKTPSGKPDPAKGKGWHSLLLEKPTVFMAPNAADGFTLLHNAVDQEVIVTSSNVCMLDLGEIESEDYEFTINLTQTPWIGGIGVYFGFRQDKLVDSTLEQQGPAITCQALELLHAGNSLREVALGRSALTIGGKRQFRARETLELVPLEPEAVVTLQLKFRVKQGQLTSIQCGGREFPELVGEEIEEALSSRNVTASGKVGLIVAQSSAVFRTAAWRSNQE